MDPRRFICCLFVVGILPIMGNAQVGVTPAPLVTAEREEWQILGEPVFHAGSFYYPAGPSVFFDGRTMVRTGDYNGVPLYADTTLEPYGLVLVPVGGSLMRPYERRREGELAGTFGSRMPSYPIQRIGDVSLATDGWPERGQPQQEPVDTFDRPGTGVAVPPAQPVGTTGADPAFTVIQSIPPPESNAGVWINFEGQRYYLAGAAITAAPERFVAIGSYRGFPVYVERGGDRNTIYVAVTPDGPIAPYERR